MKDYFKAFISTLLLIGLVFLRSGFEKISEGQFVNSLGKTLTGIALKNPYPWYKDFLYKVAIPNSESFATLTMYGEFLAGLSITVSSLYILFSKTKKQGAFYLLVIGLIGGMFLNLNFWMGFGYTSPATDSLNLLMFLIELIGVIILLPRRKQHHQ